MLSQHGPGGHGGGSSASRTGLCAEPLAGCGVAGGILTPVPQASTRPLIGVSTYRQITSWWSWERDAALVPGVYLDMVEAAGGQSLLIPPARASADAGGAEGAPHGGAAQFERLVAALDGLVLIGGGDVGAVRY